MKLLLSIIVSMLVALYSFYLTGIFWFRGDNLLAILAGAVCIGTIAFMWRMGSLETLQ